MGSTALVAANIERPTGAGLGQIGSVPRGSDIGCHQAVVRPGAQHQQGTQGNFDNLVRAVIHGGPAPLPVLGVVGNAMATSGKPYQ